jgi:sugar (pentulose or hexulose) kinase
MDLDELGRAASALEKLGAVMYPLAGTGERFPFIAAQAHAFTIGQPSGVVEQFAAALLGVACIERLCFDYLRIVGAPIDGPMSITGGGVRSPFWNQLRADVLGTPLHIPASAEAAFGAAVLAASHNHSVEAAADSMTRMREVIQPRTGEQAALNAMYLRLIHALEERGWLPEHVADSARTRVHA